MMTFRSLLAAPPWGRFITYPLSANRSTMYVRLPFPSRLRTCSTGLCTFAALALSHWGMPVACAQPPAAKVEERVRLLLGEPGVIAGNNLTTTPKPRPGPAKIETPEADFSAFDAHPPLVPLPTRAAVKPASPTEPSPLTASYTTPIVPQAVVLNAGLLARQQAFELKTADPVPYLGLYVKDRISVTDPSMEISAQGILTPQNPERLAPAPFTPLNLPDPFEHATVVRLRTAWTEAAEPPLFLQQPTRR